MKKTSTFVVKRHPQKGFALLVALIFLIVLTVLAISVLRSSTLGERIAGNDLDRMRAYQAAEATIRDAQQDIMFVNSSGVSIGLPQTRDPAVVFSRDSGFTDIPDGCSAGYCKFSKDVYNLPTFIDPWLGASPNAGKYAEFGQFTGSDWRLLLNEQFDNTTATSGKQRLSQRPRYWIEVFKKPDGSALWFRITARAWGVNTNTVVTLQEVFEPGI